MDATSNDPDADDETRWNVKTANRARSVELPGRLEDDLRTLCEGDVDALMFQQQDGRPRTATWLHGLVHRVCESAGGNVVPPHGLRATYSSILHELYGKTFPEVGDALGHTPDGGKTAQRHYIGSSQQRPSLQLDRRQGKEQ